MNVGDFDPFGEFDLLSGAVRYNLEDRGAAGALRRAHTWRLQPQRWSQGAILLRIGAVGKAVAVSGQPMLARAPTLQSAS
jgi:hypothetical protein